VRGKHPEVVVAPREPSHIVLHGAEGPETLCGIQLRDLFAPHVLARASSFLDVP
jgi:hypothetical protein